MAARFTQLLCIACNVCIILHVCSLQGILCDVPDGVVYTDLHKTVQKGDSVVLTCRFRGTPLAVYWKKGDDPRSAPNLVSWIPTDDVTGLCEGVRPCQIMEMNENRSLVIKRVSIAEQGRYICRVSSYKNGLIHNFTDIRIFFVPIIIVLVIGAVGLFALFCRKHPHPFRRITTGNKETGSKSAATNDPEENISKATIAGSNSATTTDPGERIPMVETTTIAAPPRTVTLEAVETYDACSLYRPHDVILHAGKYVITDTNYGRIVCLSATNGYSVLYEDKSPDLPFRPFSIAALSDTENSFLITDKERGNVFKLKSEKLSPFSSTYQDFHTPTGITLNRTRDRVYIADSVQHCILVFNIDGTYLGRRGEDSLIQPWFIACNSKDNIYVTDTEGIKVFDPEWRYLTTVTIKINERTWSYRGIAIDTCDNIFITARSRDYVFNKKETVAAINANHLLVKEYTGTIIYHKYLRGVCIDYERNRVVVVNSGKHTIATYTLY